MAFGCEGNNNIEDSMLIKTSMPLFFKIILHNTVRNGKLMIPPQFTKNYGNVLPGSVQLCVRTGETWQVKLETRKGEIWLKNGWKEFADHYSLAFGHLVLFQYQGNCNFHVFIFDKTATEIEYSLGRPGSTHPDHQQPQHDVAEPGKTEVGVSLRLKRKEKLTFPCPRPCKIMKALSTGRTHNASKLQSPISAADATESSDIKLLSCRRSPRGGMVMNNNQTFSKSGSSIQPFSSPEKVLCRVRAFESKNPFFKVVMHPSYIHPATKLAVPRDFAEKYFPKGDGNIILSLSDSESTWSAKYYHQKSKKIPGTKISDGWREFVVCNYLKGGDVCVFELINRKELSFRVVIFRLKDAPSPIEAADGKKTNEVEIIRAGRKLSSSSSSEDASVEILENLSGQELIKKLPPVQHQPHETVKIEAKLWFKTNPEEQGNAAGPSNLISPVGFSAQSNFTSDYPFFKVVLHTSNLKRCYLYVPSLIMNCIKHEQQRIIELQVGGRSWPVKLIRYQLSKGQLCGGWRVFAKDNVLQVGDTLAFELIKADVLLVSIFRNGS